MADSKPVISLTGAWTDVYAESGYAVGVPLIMQVVKGNADFAIKEAKPSANELGGRLLLNQDIQLAAGESGLWARAYGGDAEVAVQDARGALKFDPYVPSESLEQLGRAIDVFGQMNVAEYTPIVGQKPLPGLSFLRDMKVGGDAEFSVVNGEIKIDGTLGMRSLYTEDYGFYLPGLIGMAGIRTRAETPNSGTYRFGYGNGSGDRAGFELIDGAWATFVEAGGVRWYSQDRANWLDPLDGTGPSGIDGVDLNGHTFRLIIGWYGGLSILFTVVVPSREEGDRVVVIDSSGTRSDGVTLEQPDLPIFSEASGGILYVGGRQYGVFGRFGAQSRITSSEAETKNISSTFVPILSFRVKSASRWEAVPVEVHSEVVSSAVDAEYAVIIGGTLTGAVFGNISGIDSEETALEVDTTATAISGGYRSPGGLVNGGSGNSNGEPMFSIPNINIPAGKTVTLVARSLGIDGNFTGILRMRELF